MAAICSNVVVSRCAGGVTSARLSARSVRPAGVVGGLKGLAGATGVVTLGRVGAGARNRSAGLQVRAEADAGEKAGTRGDAEVPMTSVEGDSIDKNLSNMARKAASFTAPDATSKAKKNPAFKVSPARISRASCT
jgi:hypothetical protein